MQYYFVSQIAQNGAWLGSKMFKNLREAKNAYNLEEFPLNASVILTRQNADNFFMGDPYILAKKQHKEGY